MEMLELALWVIGILLFFYISTLLLKKFANAQTFYLGSMIKTTRFLPLLDRFARHKKILNIFADIGLILGFGAIAIDYLFGKKLRIIPRVLLFTASTIILFLGFNFFFQVLLANPFIEKYNFFLSLGFGLMGFSGFLVVSLAAYAEFVISSAFAGEKTCPGVAPLLPGVSLPNFPITIPLHGWISILIILVIHEGMHGVLARKAKIAIKSAGLLLFGILPIGAFVEPDEKQLSKSPEKEQLRVFAAGPMANLTAAAIVFAFLAVIFSGIITPFALAEYKQNIIGVSIAEVDQNRDLCGKFFPSPAFEKLEKGMQVTEINGEKVFSTIDLSSAVKESGKNPYELTVLKKSDSNSLLVQKIIIQPDEMGYSGFSVENKFRENTTLSDSYVSFLSILGIIQDFLFWFFIIGFLVGIANFLPLEPFDGGKIAKIFLVPYFGFLGRGKEETGKLISKIFFVVIMALIVLNAVPFFL